MTTSKSCRKHARISLRISIFLVAFVQLAAATSNSSEPDKIATQQDDLASTTNQQPVALGKGTRGAGSARSGRMLDLDVMAGELAKDEKLAKERLLNGNRQSRILSEDIKLPPGADQTKLEGRSPKKSGAKKMSIKGFIPIVSLDNAGGKHNFEALDQDSDSDSDSAAESDGAEQQNNLRDHLANSYGGQTSIGHASFAPAPNQQPNSEWQSVGGQSGQDQPEAARANRKLLGSSSILSGLTGGPGRRGLVSSFMPSSATQSHGFGGQNGYNTNQQFQLPVASLGQLGNPMNVPSLQAASSQFSPTTSMVDSSVGGADCICVPFFQCKNGFLSDSQLSKSQLLQFGQPTTGGSMHQIPRSLSGFSAATSGSQQVNDLYSMNPNGNQQQTNQMSPQANQFQNDNQQQQQQQQFVNEMIYEQLRKNIESSNLEQQLQQQEAYNQANQQQLSMINERRNANVNSSTAEGEERGLLSPLVASRRQYQSGAQKCGIMRTCCRLPAAKSIRGAHFEAHHQSRPLMNSGAARFVQTAPSLALASPASPQYQLIASPTISRPQFQHKMLQAARPSQLTGLLAPPNGMQQDFSYNQQLVTEAYPSTVQAALMQQQQQQQLVQQQQQQQQLQTALRPSNQMQASGAFMQGRCGMRQTLGISGRVQNAEAQQQPGADSSAEFGEFPAHAAILKRLSPGDSLFVCSAVLISSQWLATAAHCVRKSRPEELKVRLGEWDVNRDDEFYPFFEANVREILLHPDFQSSSLINDIALIRLEQPVDQQQMPHIAPACLATEQAGGDGSSSQFVGQRCWVAGWGKNAFGQQGTFQSVLKKVDLPVVSHQECELALKYQTKLGKHFRLHSSNICAGGERGKDACEGDGGAGLYCVDPASGLSRAVGLVSWGVGCGQRSVPGVYVSLAHFGGWIEHVVATSGEENVYLDARINSNSSNSSGNNLGMDTQAFKSIISERSNFNANTTQTAAAAAAAATTTSQPEASNADAGSNTVTTPDNALEARHSNANKTLEAQ